MPMTGVVGLFLLCAGAAQAVSPVQKVIQLLDEYKVKVQGDLAKEETAMAEYMDFCDTETSEKGYAIKTAASKITSLAAEIEDGEARIASFSDEVSKAGTEMAGKEKQLDAASAARDADKAAFQKNEAELITSIDELERAALEMKKPAEEPALVQMRGASKVSQHHLTLKNVLNVLGRVIDASWVNEVSRRKIQGLMQTADGSEEEEGDDLQLRAPKADAFESSTGGIDEMLEDMKEKAETALTDARNGETQKSHTFDMMAQSLTDGMSALKEKISDAKGEINSASEEVGENNGELTETEKCKNSDEKYLSSLTQDCEDARDGWATRQEEAKAEMGALSKAKEILSSRVKVLVQVAGSTKSQRDIVDDAPTPAEARTRQAVVAKMQELGHKFKSYAMMEMVSAAAADPFEKIKGLIESMIAKLISEANAEATQKAFCDEEMGKSKASKDEKNMDLEKLQSRIDTATAKLAELGDTSKETEAEVADLDKATAEATKLRTEEKADNGQSSKDFKEAAEAVEQAIEVLKEYYEGASFAQVGSAKQPAFGSKKSDAGSTIISILEMAGEDFTKTYMELQTKESAAAAAYKKLSDEAAVSRATKLAEVKGMSSQMKSLEVALKNQKEDFAVTTSELDAVMSYLEKLKPQCESQAMSGADKKSRREAEIEGLKEALQLLTAA